MKPSGADWMAVLWIADQSRSGERRGLSEATTQPPTWFWLPQPVASGNRLYSAPSSAKAAARVVVVHSKKSNKPCHP